MQMFYPFTAEFSNAYYTMCRKCVLQINRCTSTHKLYTKSLLKPRNNIIRLDLVNRKPQERIGAVKYKKHFTQF